MMMASCPSSPSWKRCALLKSRFSQIRLLRVGFVKIYFSAAHIFLGSSDSPKMCDVHGWRPLFTLKSRICENLLFSSAHLFQEGDEGHEAIIILWFTKLLHETLSFL